MGGEEQAAAGRRERRRTAIIAAARASFLERGYEAVTLGEIVRISGGSLATLYALFNNKEGLLRAVVQEERYEGIERLDAIVARNDTPAVTIARIAGSIVEAIGRPEVMQLMRVVMAKSLCDPHFARAIYDNTHRPHLEWLTDLFTRWREAGQARIADPATAAHLFLGLTLHNAQTRAIYGEPAGVPTSAASLANAIALFIAGYGIADVGDRD